MPQRAIAARCLPLVDLTNLTDTCDVADIEALCRAAVTPHGSVAAVCLYPRFVADAVRFLSGTTVRIATVVNFPGGGEDTVAVERETFAAVEAGANEIDLVMPYTAFMAGRSGFAETQIVRVKRACGAARLKVILETGRLMLPETIRAASDLAIAAGADFIKTSTGKVEINATPSAARIMLAAIRTSGRAVGFKAAGGVRTTTDAADYLTLADDIMGPGWVSPETFRFGASGLLTDLLAHLDGTTTASVTGY
jgi:deoxyribose-phosphate aldolase